MPRASEPSVARRERAALCDLFLEVGPDAPTLCEGWAARDLAAHLVVRERRPDAAPGILVAPLAFLTRRAMAQEAARPWPDLVARVRSGPPAGPWRLLDATLNLQEYVVHHEDVRRANGLGPRPEAASVQRAIAAALRRQAPLLALRLRGANIRVELDMGIDGVVVVRDGESAVTVVGDPIEQALFLTGRTGAAAVVLDGHPKAVRRLRAAKLGL